MLSLAIIAFEKAKGAQRVLCLGFLAVLLSAGTSACSSSSSKNRYLLAEKLWTDGSYSAAVTEFEKVAANDPRGKLGLQALYRAAMTQTLYLQQYEEALRKFRSFIEGSNEPALLWEAQKQIGEILFAKTEQYESAIQHYRTLSKIRPNAVEMPEFLHRIAKSHFFLSRFDEAADAFRDLAQRYPNHPLGERADLEVGITLFTRGEHNPGGQGTGAESYQEAMDAYQDFLKKHPSSPHVPEAKFGIASCLEEMDQLDAAYHQFETLLSTYPSPNVIRIKLARIRERKAQKSR